MSNFFTDALWPVGVWLVFLLVVPGSGCRSGNQPSLEWDPASPVPAETDQEPILEEEDP